MLKPLLKLGISTLISLTISSMALADTEMKYHQTKLPDGSTQIMYSDSEGNKVTQVQRLDGSMEMQAVDHEGNETITTQHANGETIIKTKEKSH